MEIDPSAVTASVLTELIKSSFFSVGEKASRSARETWAKVFEDFDPFMRDAYRKNMFVRLLSQKEKDVPLEAVYVTTFYKSGGTRLKDDELVNYIESGKNIVINGNGGAGKTFFMRHLWSSLFSKSSEFTPIFIELRKLNDLTTINIRTFIARTISRKKELDSSLFDYFCGQGRFCFILDGFDEVVVSQREALQKEILDFSNDFPSCRFVVSSRYEQRFSGWQNFELFESLPFDLHQVQSLVAKVPFDEKAKKSFQKQLTPGFYDNNKSFLSNPLLAIMMMMTFRENMDIPRRMNIFYDQAFTTLYQWHDATKAYTRSKSLDIEEFQRSFGVFCLLSYYKEKFEFTKSEVIDLISQSNKVCSLNVNPENILKDYEESVNLLRQEGLRYVFIHRSFQEYFTALAMTRVVPMKFGDLISGVCHRYNDSVLTMCFEMNKSLLLEKYIQPLFERLQNSGKIRKLKDERFGFMSRFSVVYSILKKGNGENIYTISAMFIDADPEVKELFNNVRKLMGKEGNLYDYVDSMLIGRNLFTTFSDALRNTKAELLGMAMIRVNANDIHVSVDNIELYPDQGKSFVTEFENHISLDYADFDYIESKLSKEVKEVSNWCVSELRANAKRKKSLDEILEL